jgi:hypothetical protein
LIRELQVGEDGTRSMMAGRTRGRISLAALTLTGCWSIHIDTDPKPPASPPPRAELVCHLEFEGNREFLPQSLVAASDADSAAPRVRYHYQALYYPPGEGGVLHSDVVAQGFLEIERPDREPRTLVEQCTVSMTHSIWIFERPTASDLRALALRCVRDQFDARLGAL